MASQGVSVALLRPLAELLGRLDEDPARFLATLGVAEDSPPDLFVAGDHVDRVLDAIAARRGDGAFGLTLARAAVVKPMGLFGHMVWLSGTVRDAIARATRFFAMVSRRTAMTLEVRGDVATIQQRRVADLARGAILTEYVFASFALRARAATAERFTLRAVRFCHRRGRASRARYARTFAAPVAFSAAADELEFDARQLDLPLAGADPITSAVLEAKVAALAATAERNPFVDRVRAAAAAHLADPPSLHTVAARLGISARTLRRRLADDGTSLRELIDQLRRERADELLAAGSSVKEVAFTLGFSEPSAFSRAYKRWTGRSPRPA